MKKKNYFLLGVVMVLFTFIVFLDAKNIQAANPKESPIQLLLNPDPSSEINVKMGDKLKYSITLSDSGGYAGKVSISLRDVPPGVNATLKMDSDHISSGGNVKGTLDLDIVGKISSGKNRLVLSFGPSDYTFCGAYDITCAWRADFMNSKILYLNGIDINYKNSTMPAVIESVEPSVLKRVKLFVSDFRRENPGFSLMDIVYGKNPFLVADEMIGIYCKGQENCQAGDVDYEQWYVTKIDLSDPLNPKKAERGVMINQADRIFGHGVRPTSLGMSRDGNLSFITWLRGDLFMASKNPSVAKTHISNLETELSPTGNFIIADSSSDTFLIRSIYKNDGGNRFEKVSDFQMKQTASMPAEIKPGIDYRDFVPAPIPSNVPEIADYGTPTAVIRALDGESSDYIVVIGNDGKNTPQIALGGKDYKLSDLSFYSLEKKDALGVAKLSGLDGLDPLSVMIYGFETPNGKYAFVSAKEKSAKYDSKRTFYLYGLNEAEKKLIPIMVKGLVSDAGEIKSVAPVHVSGKDFLVMFMNSSNSNQNPGYSSKVLIYSFDDLRVGKIKNIASPSISSMKQIIRAISLIKNGETYMYTIDEQGAFLIWKFDKDSFRKSSVIFGATTNTPVYSKKSVTVDDSDCLGGTVYQTSAGPLCVNTSSGVTTTTSYDFGTTSSSNEKAESNKKIEFMGPPVYDLGTTTLKNGSSGEAVKELQRFLNNKLNLGLVIDGKLGPKTIAVIKKWQSDNGLVPDGLVGPKTKGLINSSI